MENNKNGYTPSIPGVSDVDIMPRRGFVRLGESMEERAKQGLNYPKELDHLGRVDASEDDKKLYHSLYGNEPKAIKIVFVSNSPTENFPQEFVSWNSRGQKTCYGNGRMGFQREISLSEQAKKKLDSAKDQKEREFLESRLSPDDYDYKETPISCPGFECPKYKDGKCQLEGTLKFLIVGMKGLRLWWIRTGSKWTMKTIRTMHENIRSLTSPNGDPDFGRIRGIPLLLTREQKQYTLPNGMTTKKWVLSLDVADVGISDLLSLADPKAITGRAKEAMVALEGKAEGDKETPEVVQPEVEENQESEIEPEEGIKSEEKEKEDEFDPENRKKHFLDLDQTAQIETLQKLMKRKGYDRSNLKKTLDRFTDEQREAFWDKLNSIKDKDEKDDDVPF